MGLKPAQHQTRRLPAVQGLGAKTQQRRLRFSASYLHRPHPPSHSDAGGGSLNVHEQTYAVGPAGGLARRLDACATPLPSSGGGDPAADTADTTHASDTLNAPG